MVANVQELDKVAYVEGSPVPWHRTNCVTFRDDMSLSEQWDLTSLNYEVECRPLFLEDGSKVTQRAICRTDNDQAAAIARTGAERQISLDKPVAFAAVQVDPGHLA